MVISSPLFKGVSVTHFSGRCTCAVQSSNASRFNVFQSFLKSSSRYQLNLLNSLFLASICQLRSMEYLELSFFSSDLAMNNLVLLADNY